MRMPRGGCVAVLYDEVKPDALPDEQDVLVQVDHVGQALTRLGYDVVPLAMHPDPGKAAQSLRDLGPMFVFNLVECVDGQGDLIVAAPVLLEALCLPYTGARFKALVSTSNKVLTKHILASENMPTPAWVVPGGREPDPDGGPWIVKPRWEDASLGIDDGAIVGTGSELRAALMERRSLVPSGLFAERFIDGREFNVSLIAKGGKVRTLPIAEIVFADFPNDKPRIVGYAAKWDSSSFEYHHTPRSFEAAPGDAAVRAQMSRLARRCWEIFDLSGYARVDFRVDADGAPWILEVNANPCLSPDAGFAAALSQAGIEFDKAMGWIVEEALGHRTSPSYAAR